MSVERNERALIELVERACEDRRREILDAAGRDADALRRGAHAEARSVMRHAFAAEREATRERIDAATAHLETRQRAATQQRSKALAATALELMPEALRARWRDPAQRAAWIARTLEAALHALPKGAWRIVLPPDFPEDEREKLAATIAERDGTPPVIAADPRIDAGVAIASGGASIDATLAALLADRVELGARLLDRIATLEEPATSTEAG